MVSQITSSKSEPAKRPLTERETTATHSITTDVLESYTYCRYKAHLRLRGQRGIISDYQAIVAETAENVGLKVFEKAMATYPVDAVVTGIELTRNNLRKGPAFIFYGRVEDGTFSLKVDGLKRVLGDSALGNFHYVPVLFCGHYHVPKESRILAEGIGHILTGIQRRQPAYGIIHYGSTCKATTIRFRKRLQSGRLMVNDIGEMLQDQAPPKLLLNEHCDICEFHEQCHALAVEEDNLSLLRSIRQKEVTSYSRKGIFSLSQLAYTFRPRRPGSRVNHRRQLPLQAKAIFDKTVYVLGDIEIPSSLVSIYLDIESDPYAGFVYLIGIIVCEGNQEDRYSFWTDTKEEESRIFEQFLAVYSRYEAPVVFCYGAYERTFLQRMRRNSPCIEIVDRVLASLVNVLSIIYSHFYFPTHSNGLKQIGRLLGATWTDDKSSGIQSIAWHLFWGKTGDEHWKDKLITYNIEDCLALQNVTCFLRTACSDIHAPAPAQENTKRSPMVVNAQRIERTTYDVKWSRTRYGHPDLEFVRSRAYFDYQRQRVYVRTNKTIRNHRKAASRQKFHKPRVSQHVDIFASKCPQCGGHDLSVVPRNRARGTETKGKRAFNLIITPSTTKRKVIEYHTTAYRCSQCGHEFVPEQYQQVSKYHHDLVSWATYHHIAHRLSSRSIESMFRDLFSLNVSKTDIHMFKTVMAQRYKKTYQDLLSKLVSGSVLHADETEVKLRSGKAYVWVFTNLEEVVYVYRPDRKGDFLHEFLNGFSGVLVSDFYAAYDSLPCSQQKCLIHLIRDMNQDILSNPFDAELLSITGKFGSLIRSIVSAIDLHGLKRAKLMPYKRRITKFFHGLQGESYRSNVANALKERVLKNQNELFTFVEHDGVPWNNNNAEYAIKTFAQYRDEAAGVFRESGLSDYLTLLSIFQTCRYKGVSFLKFLLSGDDSLDRFCSQKRRRHQPQQIEFLPSGFDPYRNSRRRPTNG